jgi:hypothetical protein
MVGVTKVRIEHGVQRTFAAGKIQSGTLKLAGLFIDQPESGEIVSKITSNGCRRRVEQFTNVQFRNDVVVDFQQQPEPIPFLHHLSLVKLCSIPRQRALHGNRNVQRQSTQQFDIFGGKFLALQLCYGKKSISFLGGRDWK